MSILDMHSDETLQDLQDMEALHEEFDAEVAELLATLEPEESNGNQST